jgi:hypothetical protein
MKESQVSRMCAGLACDSENPFRLVAGTVATLLESGARRAVNKGLTRHSSRTARGGHFFSGPGFSASHFSISSG